MLFHCLLPSHIINCCEPRSLSHTQIYSFTKAPKRRQKCHFDTFEIIFHPQTLFREYDVDDETSNIFGEKGKVFLSWLTSYFSRMLFPGKRLLVVLCAGKQLAETKQVKRKILRFVFRAEVGEKANYDVGYRWSSL